VCGKVEIETGTVLKFKAPLHAIAFPVNEWGHETDDFEVLAQFIGIPNLSVLGFESLTTSRLGIDFDEALTTKGFGIVGHLRSPWVGCPRNVQLNLGDSLACEISPVAISIAVSLPPIAQPVSKHFKWPRSSAPEVRIGLEPRKLKGSPGARLNP
jgi:hypothetical protein